jgi:hypothetical protein
MSGNNQTNQQRGRSPGRRGNSPRRRSNSPGRRSNSPGRRDELWVFYLGASEKTIISFGGTVETMVKPIRSIMNARKDSLVKFNPSELTAANTEAIIEKWYSAREPVEPAMYEMMVADIVAKNPLLKQSLTAKILFSAVARQVLNSAIAAAVKKASQPKAPVKGAWAE